MASMESSLLNAEAVWRIGVFDAHCHPTDIVSSVRSLIDMRTRALTIMASRSQDQELVAESARKFRYTPQKHHDSETEKFIIPAFGWHPWFSYQFYDDRLEPYVGTAIEHFRSVLTPTPDDDEYLSTLPPPVSLKEFLEQTEKRLIAFPEALVGEIGLDRSFRLPKGPFMPAGDVSKKTGGTDEAYTPGSREGRPLTPYKVNIEHQKLVLRAQLELAGKHERAVSVHSVQTHGVVFDLLQSMWKGYENKSKRSQRRNRDTASLAADKEARSRSEAVSPRPFPPRICMHSYTGSAESLKQFLNPAVPAKIFFSFSACINFSDLASRKVVEAIKAVPDELILIESDFHCAGEKMDVLLLEVIAKVCEIRAWDIEQGARQLRSNWEAFVHGAAS